MKVIAVDFDGCLCENQWPEIGEPRQQIINELVKRQADGAKLILWTCREGKRLDEAVAWCLNHGLKFDAVNDNLPENIALYENNCRKVWADEYWDDKSVLIVATGKVTSVAFARTEGGMVVKQWMSRDLQFVGNPWKPKKRKKWWQRWR